MSKKVILTGIRANNDLTIGNYFGAIMPIIDMAKSKSKEYQVNLFVPDLHSFTTPIDHSKLQEQIMHNLRLFVAAGLPLDSNDVYIYRQSYVPAHSELTWILDCFTEVGEMQRMTQYRDKSGKLSSRDIAFQAMNELRHELADNYWEDDNIEDKINARINKISGSQKSSDSVGLFNYPVLMASDILLYNATYIPVGEDQTQHLEFTRDIAERLNNKFSQELFIVPESVKKQHEFFGKDQGLRIKDLQDPTKKMSKSDDSGKGVIFLGDAPELASKKIMGAATDSIGSINLDWENQPGISNLLQILSLFKNKNITEIESEWKGNTSYGELKKAVSEEVESFLNNLQEKLKNIDDDEIINKLESSEKLMNEVANATLNKVQKAVGLR